VPPGLALGKEGFFKKKILILCQVPAVLVLGKEAPLPNAKRRHSANRFYFFFFLPPNFFCSPHTILPKVDKGGIFVLRAMS